METAHSPPLSQSVWWSVARVSQVPGSVAIVRFRFGGGEVLQTLLLPRISEVGGLYSWSVMLVVFGVAWMSQNGG